MQEITEEWLQPKVDEPLIDNKTSEGLGLVETVLDNFAESPDFLKALST